MGRSEDTRNGRLTTSRHLCFPHHVEVLDLLILPLLQTISLDIDIVGLRYDSTIRSHVQHAIRQQGRGEFQTTATQRSNLPQRADPDLSTTATPHEDESIARWAAHARARAKEWRTSLHAPRKCDIPVFTGGSLVRSTSIAANTDHTKPMCQSQSEISESQGCRSRWSAHLSSQL